MKRFSKKIDHLGQIAGTFNEIGRAQMMDRIIPADPRKTHFLDILKTSGLRGRQKTSTTT